MSRNNKKDWDIETLLSVIGFVFELVRVIVNALRKRSGTIDHLRRLLKEPALVDKVFDLIVVPGTATKPVLDEGEYLVPIDYAPLPSKADLEKDYGKDNVSVIFDGREFTYHASCVGVDQTPGERIMLVKHFGRNTESEANIAEMDKLGYRPATHIEACAFAKSNPELQRKFWIVALGSFALDGGRRCVAVLRSASGGRIFVSGWFDSGWSADYRFLFVRK